MYNYMTIVTFCHHYNELKELFCSSTSNTRTKSLLLPKINKEIGKNNHKFIAYKYCNKISESHKNICTKNYKKKLKMSI